MLDSRVVFYERFVAFRSGAAAEQIGPQFTGDVVFFGQQAPMIIELREIGINALDIGPAHGLEYRVFEQFDVFGSRLAGVKTEYGDVCRR